MILSLLQNYLLDFPNSPSSQRMKEKEVVGELRKLAQEIGGTVTKMHPLTGQLHDQSTRGEVLKGLFELTKQVEVIKKHLLKLEKGAS